MGGIMKTQLFLLLGVGVLSSALNAGVESHVQYAKEVVVNRMTSAHPVPSYVMDRTKCIAALRVVKAGFIWGGQGSTGLVSCRTEKDGWSAPSFFQVSGVNFGLQIGVQFLESVLTFMTDTAREILLRPTFQLGADLSFAAGPVGEGGGVGAIPNAHVLSYQRAVGLYAGATVNGFIVSHLHGYNSRVYGANTAPKAIFELPGQDAPAVVQPFVTAVIKYFPIH